MYVILCAILLVISSCHSERTPNAEEFIFDEATVRSIGFGQPAIPIDPSIAEDAKATTVRFIFTKTFCFFHFFQQPKNVFTSSNANRLN